MSKLFYLSEIINFAIEKEKESAALYEKLANIVSDQKIKELFESMLQDEKEHANFYAQLLNDAPKEQTAGVKEDSEYEAYMQALITASRSTSPVNTIDLKDINTILNYAADREKDSILFYVGLKNHVPTSSHNKIEIIIQEEAKHLTKLLLLKNT